MISWLVSELHPQSPVFWLLVSIVATIGLATAYWRTRRVWITWLWIGQWILIPYLGLISGGISPRLMGLAYLDWPATLGFGSGLLFVILALLVAVRIAAEISDRLPAQSLHAGQQLGRDHDDKSSTSGQFWRYAALIIVLGGIEEFHWVFLRGALWETLFLAPTAVELPAYWSIWLAAAAVVFETALRRPSFEQWLVQVTVLATTSILFLYTRNFWLCWILHCAAILILTANSRTQALLPAQIAAGQR